MVRQSHDDAIRALQANVRFLRRSGEAFDAGDEAEAGRVALAVRVLVWDKGQNKSLLGILGHKDSLEYVDTANEPIEKRPGILTWPTQWGLAGFTALPGGGAGWEASLEGRPRLEPARFSTWWERPLITDPEGNEFSREDLVLFLVHKEGAAHFEPVLPAPYGELVRLNSLGYSFSDAEGEMRPAGSLVPANVRQIGWELQTTIEEQLADLL
jgi:hypothetical protein